MNTPRLITDQNNNVVWNWSNDDPFGANIPNENPSGFGVFKNNLRYPGQYFDVETGLHYNYYRYYDPQLGNYTTADPIGNVLFKDMAARNLSANGPVNRDLAERLYSKTPIYNQSYSYVPANPLSSIDPYDLSKFDKTFGLSKDFWNWYHRRIKKPGDPDFTKEEARELCEEWKKTGKPGPDNKSSQRGSADPELLDWFIPWWATPSSLACSDLNCPAK